MSKLFVYGVNSNCPRETLEAEFARCGEVTDVYITEKGYVKHFFLAVFRGENCDKPVKIMFFFFNINC